MAKSKARWFVSIFGLSGSAMLLLFVMAIASILAAISSTGSYVEASNSEGPGGIGTGTGLFTWPVPSYTYISSPYGERSMGFHRGIDIAGPGIIGAETVAADGGEVVVAQYGHYSWGNYVQVDHGNGYRTLYAHCLALNVSVGDYVDQGQVIAFVGNSGNVVGENGGYHLHFEVEFEGDLLDPLLLWPDPENENMEDEYE